MAISAFFVVSAILLHKHKRKKTRMFFDQVFSFWKSEQLLRVVLNLENVFLNSVVLMRLLRYISGIQIGVFSNLKLNMLDFITIPISLEKTMYPVGQ